MIFFLPAIFGSRNPCANLTLNFVERIRKGRETRTVPFLTSPLVRVKSSSREEERERRINSKVAQYQTFQLKSYVPDGVGSTWEAGTRIREEGKKRRIIKKVRKRKWGTDVCFTFQVYGECAHDR